MRNHAPIAGPGVCQIMSLDTWIAFCDDLRYEACGDCDYPWASFWRDERDYGFDWYMGQEIEFTSATTPSDHA